LQALVAAHSALTRAEIAVKAPMSVGWLGYYLEATGRPIVGLVSLGYVREEIREGQRAWEYAITPAGRCAVAMQ
jgi:hypothetical protein